VVELAHVMKAAKKLIWGEGRREKGEGRREKGEGEGEGRWEMGAGRRELGGEMGDGRREEEGGRREGEGRRKSFHSPLLPHPPLSSFFPCLPPPSSLLL
jgi:hypothetical protein